MASDLTEGPAHRGWWPTLKRIAHNVTANQLTTQAAAVTFYGLLAIFPALGALVSLFGLIADPHVVQDQLHALGAVMPGGAMQVLDGQLHALTSASGKSLGIGAVVGLLVSLWSANAATKAIFSALNAAYGETEKRGYVHLTLITLALTACALLFIILAIAFVVALPALLGFIGLDTLGKWLILILRWPLLLAAITALLAALYGLGPSRGAIRWRWLTAGSLVAAVGWLVASLLFSWYVAHFGSYNRTYGSLGAVAGFMTWIWISTLVVLVGAAFDAEAEREDAPSA